MDTGSMGTDTADPDGWDRGRLLRTLLVVALAGVALLGGLGYAVYSAVTSAGHDKTHTPNSVSAVAAGRAAARLAPGQVRRDAVAAAPMLAVPPEASRSGTPAGSPGPAITIPAAGRLGPARVPTGFPQTPEGAVGQLAVLETTVLQGMSIEAARTVYAAWSVPDAPPVQTWELIANIQAFLASGAGLYADEVTTAVVATPVAGQVKGVDGPDWVVACVLLDVKARAAAQARIAYGHCERMQWRPTEITNTTDSTDSPGSTASTGQGRWVIAAGPAPARAPSTWPGTDLAARAGWRTWAPTGGE